MGKIHHSFEHMSNVKVMRAETVTKGVTSMWWLS